MVTRWLPKVNGVRHAGAEAPVAMKSMKRVLACLVLACAATAAARADDGPSIGVSVNGTTGAHVEPVRTESIPFLALPTIELGYSRNALRAHVEIMPPIGPVPLAQGSSPYLDAPDPRVSYMSGELDYAPFGGRYCLGVGETILNQRTEYPPHPYATASRVVGMRLVAGGAFYSRGNSALSGSFAVSPSMRGVQDGDFGERASLVDTQLRWSTTNGPYRFSYGVRYVNYAAAYTDRSELADRNHLFMPFVAIDWKPSVRRRSAAAPHAATRENAAARFKPWRAGLTLLGTNGYREVASIATPLNFVLQPLFSLERRDAHSIVAFEAIFPNQSSNLFGSPGQLWSYLNADALVRFGKGRTAAGIGESVVNLAAASPPPYVEESGRSEGLHAVVRTVVARSAREETFVRLSASPYLHLHSVDEYFSPRLPHSIGVESYQHGSRVDTSIGQRIEMRGYAFAFGLRYIDQTTNYGHGELTRSSSFMPFAGIVTGW